MKPAEVHVWKADLDALPQAPEGGLSQAERARQERLRVPELRRRWGASRWALRTVLARYLDEAPEEIELTLGERGKPQLAIDPERLGFNLSHSAGIALVAVAAGPVGVDVERIDPRRDVLRLAERVLLPEDVRAVADAGPEQRADVFYAVWTRHEARLKCHGGGFGGEPSTEPVAAVSVEVPSGYCGAVAIPGGAPPIQRSFSLDSA